MRWCRRCHLYADTEGRHGRFFDVDRDRLASFAAHAAAALAHARHTDALAAAAAQQAAELAVINSIQQAVGAALDFQAIVDAVGDKLREVFGSGDLGIRWWDEASSTLRGLYSVEHGQRLPPNTMKVLPGSEADRVLRGRQVVVYGTIDEQVAKGVPVTPGTDRARSVLIVPMLAADRLLGVVTLEDHQRDHAFGDSQVRLVQTIASSMAVALLNAKSFEAERQRAAELAVINSIQHGLASQLDLQAIVGLVGDKLREVFATGNLSISWFDEATWLVTPAYFYQDGVRLDDVQPFVASRSPRHVRMFAERRAVRLDPAHRGKSVAGTRLALSDMRAPVVAGQRVIGVVNVDNFERENAFGDDDLRLLETVCASLGAALQNARLFDEIQALLKEAEARNAELAVINRIQQAVGAALDFQAIADAVGDELCRVFAGADLAIWWWDEPRDEVINLFGAYRGRRQVTSLRPKVSSDPSMVQVLQQGRLLLAGNWAEQQAQSVGVVPGTPRSQSVAAVPIVAGQRVLGLVALEELDREHAFDAATVRLLQTVASSMGVALLNARSFEAERQRAAELAIINAVQQALAGELSLQGIYDVVGDRLREIFGGRDLTIRAFDPARGLQHFPYNVERGQRLPVDDIPLQSRGVAHHLLTTGRTLLLNRDAAAALGRLGSIPPTGTGMPRSVLVVPLVGGGQVRGGIDLVDYEREDAFADSDVRLLETLAASMGVALENARLFDETQRLLKETEARNAELAVINSIQSALVAQLDIQQIHELVGEKIREIFDAQVVAINGYDPATDTMKSWYMVERGVRFRHDPWVPAGRGFNAKAVATRRTVRVNRDMEVAVREVGSQPLPGESAQSGVWVPLVSGGEARGVITLQNLDREEAFSDADVRLLETLAASMSVALDNARLFDETQAALLRQTATAEVLQVIGRSMADAQPAFETIVESCTRLFRSEGGAVGLIDDQGLLHLRAFRISDSTRRRIGDAAAAAATETLLGNFPRPLAGTLTERAIRQGSLVETRPTTASPDAMQPGVQAAKVFDMSHMVTAPMMWNGQGIGSLNVMLSDGSGLLERERRLLQTFADQAVIAIQNARLFNEATQAREHAEIARGQAEAANDAKSSLPGHDEPRDPYADERHHRHERAAAADPARRRAARACAHRARQRREPADHHQRHPGLLEDRGRQAGLEQRAVRAARVRGLGGGAGAPQARTRRSSTGSG
jgi:GAF domain-containing protein